MDYYRAAVVAVVEGATEFLPISSTGHQILVGHLLGADSPEWKLFNVVIQLGAILSVVVLYRERFLALVPGMLHKQPDLETIASGADRSRTDRGGEDKGGEDRSEVDRIVYGFSGVAGLVKIAAACLPALVVGALAHGFVKEHLFFPLPVAVALVVGALAMLWVEGRPTTLGSSSRSSGLEQVTLTQAFQIGCFQCFSLWPGVSRAAATIVGALLVGVERRVAAEFSFIIAVPTMVAAVGYDVLKNHQLFSPENLPTFAFGFVVSFVTAMIAIRGFVSILQHATLRPFAYYRMILGVLVLLMFGV